MRWDGKTAISFPLDERDEAKGMQALLLQHPFEEAANPSDREIDTNDVISDHDKTSLSNSTRTAMPFSAAA